MDNNNLNENTAGETIIETKEETAAAEDFKESAASSNKAEESTAEKAVSETKDIKEAAENNEAEKTEEADKETKGEEVYDPLKSIMKDDEDEYDGYDESQEGKGLSVASLIVGIASILCGIVPGLGLIFAIAGVALGVAAKSKNGNTLNTVSLIVSGVGLVLALVIFCLTGFVIFDTFIWYYI